MTDKKSSESRRKLLKSIAAGSGSIVAGKSLPESWSRPVVDSVLLPAHAETSPIKPGRVYSGNATLLGAIEPNSESMLASFSNKLISKANAGGGKGGPPEMLDILIIGCAEETEEGSEIFNFWMQTGTTCEWTGEASGIVPGQVNWNEQQCAGGTDSGTGTYTIEELTDDYIDIGSGFLGGSVMRFNRAPSCAEMINLDIFCSEC